jgi:hypothetical protein
MILILTFFAAWENMPMARKNPSCTWADLEGKIALQVLHAPKTCGDLENSGTRPAVHERVVKYLYYRVSGTPWVSHLALVAAVLTARHRDVSTVVRILVALHARFTELFPALHLSTMNEWNADAHVRAYLSGEVLPETTDAVRAGFWKGYNAASTQVQSWLQSLPESEQSQYHSFVFRPVALWMVEGLTKEVEVRQQQRQHRKTETDAVVPRFSALRVEAHFRFNKMVRLYQAYQQALQRVKPDHSNLPLNFSYDEGDPAQERLSFRIWDCRAFILDPDHLYSRTPVEWAQKGIQTCSPERNSLFLEFVRAERLVGDAPPEGLWFAEILQMGMLGQKPRQGSGERRKTQRTWLQAWGYLEQETKDNPTPFWTLIPGLLSWPLAEAQFMFTAQQKTKGILVPVEGLYAAVHFGVLAVDLFTTTGMRSNEAMQARLSSDCFVRFVMNAPPGAKDQTSRVRYAFRLIPKGERTDIPQNYFIGEETKRVLVKVARMLAEAYQLQPGKPLPLVPFDPGNGRAHRFGSAAYLFQYNRHHLPDQAVSACLRFLLHGMVFQTREGKRVILKPHLLRHSFATHAVQVEKIPIDIVGEWLKQKSLDVTDYYSQPTESMIAEAVDRYLARVAVSIHVGKAVRRSAQELQQLYNQAREKVGTLADVIGGQCVSHGFCAAKFACVGCPGKVPDPAKRLQLEKHKVWALQQVTYATEEGLLPEAERMRQLARDCETELQEIEAIETYRKDEERAVTVRVETRE